VAVPKTEQLGSLPTFDTQRAWRVRTEDLATMPAFWPHLWEINRAVAEVYGLDAEDFEHILGTFPVMARKRRDFFRYLQEQVAAWRAETAPAPRRAASRR
jgi:hypothetical protein